MDSRNLRQSHSRCRATPLIAAFLSVGFLSLLTGEAGAEAIHRTPKCTAKYEACTRHCQNEAACITRTCIPQERKCETDALLNGRVEPAGGGPIVAGGAGTGVAGQVTSSPTSKGDVTTGGNTTGSMQQTPATTHPVTPAGDRTPPPIRR